MARERDFGQTTNVLTAKPGRVTGYRLIRTPRPTGDSEAIEFETRLIESDLELVHRIRHRMEMPSFVPAEDVFRQPSEQ
jgi:hypothetical protein